MPVPVLSLLQARGIALNAGASFAAPAREGPAAVEILAERIGFVQIDTISVVERAHHHIFFSRLPSYRKEWLDNADIFEYWAHAAAYLPWRDFRHTLPRKARILEGGHDWFRVERAEADRVLQRIKAEGPLMARDFEAPRKMSGWWDWKPAKRALEYLFQAGELMALKRRGFQKVFDLTERALPNGVDARMPTPAEHAAWYVERALDAWGIAARDEIAYQRREHIDAVDGALRNMEEAGEIVRVAVESVPRTSYWIRTDLLGRADDLPGPDRKLRILSPFDPFLIHRKRIKRLFEFDYALECYLPAAKRSFGYFALPLFKGARFVGVLDAKADRAASRLTVNRLRYDGPARGRPAFDAALARALDAFAAFNGAACWALPEDSD